MPDHLHCVVEAEAADSDFCRFVASAKQRSGFTFMRSHGGRLWQRGYFERVLRDEETTHAYVRYVLENPIRAGLVRDVREYPFIGSGVWPLEALLDFVTQRRR
jgi:REP element-mobilizing transposase RayT